MTIGSFNKLPELLSPMLQLNERFGRLPSGEPIACEIMLHRTIIFFAGRSYHGIRQTASISKPSFLLCYLVIIINNCSVIAVELPTDIDEPKAVAEGFDPGFLVKVP